MNYKQINLVLKNVELIRQGGNRWNPLPEELKSVKKVETRVVKEIRDGGEQSEEGLSYETYSLPFDNIMMQLEIRTDSYGDNDRIACIQFGRGEEKLVKVFTEL